ncbi:MAG: ABC transporter substrate-binding protein [Fastidiosipilaceae bacterium]|jgi:ABC-type nitrate/sulfonate/bicarbonate transport system substrate-binding protein
MNHSFTSRKRNLSLILSAVICLTALTSCGGKSVDTTDRSDVSQTTSAEQADGLQNVTLVLDWTPNTNHTGLFVAAANGYFKEEGLSVDIQQPPEDGAPVLVAANKAQFGVSFQDILSASFGREDPLPITAVGTIINHNTSGIISLKENDITSPKYLENARYATWDWAIEQAIIRNVVQTDGGDPDKVLMIPQTVTDVRTALQTNIDAVWVYYAWDGVAAELGGLDTNYWEFKDINPVFDYYSPVIIANETYLDQHPEEARAFMRAVSRGYEFSMEYPDEAAEILLEAAPELDPELVHASQLWLASRYQAEAPQWGYIEADRWDGFYAWLWQEGLIDFEIPAGKGFTNEYLPLAE